MDFEKDFLFLIKKYFVSKIEGGGRATIETFLFV